MDVDASPRMLGELVALNGLSKAAAAAVSAAVSAAEERPKTPEAFAWRAARDLSDSFTIMLLKPWEPMGNQPQPPAELLRPSMSGEGADIEPQVIAAEAGQRQALLIFTDLAQESEWLAAPRLVQRAHEALPQECCVILVLLPCPGIGGRVDSERAAHLVEKALTLGVDEVISDPPWNTMELRVAVSIACHRWRRSVVKSQIALDMEPMAPEGEAAALEAVRSNLLFGEVRRQLMQQLPPVNAGLVEDTTGVGGRYEFVRAIRHGQCDVYEARDLQLEGELVAVKVTKKSDIWNMNYFDGLYREYLLLRTKLRHDNIVRCREVLHGQACIYHIFDYAGDQSLHHLLMARAPIYRFNAEEVDHCFQQIGDAICHCHARRLSHRSLSTDHVVVSGTASDRGLKCTLVDFRSALSANDGQMGQMQHGKMPCMAPEMMAGAPHHPLRVDCWSLGAVLLEMACSRQAMSQAIGWDGQSEPSEETAEAARLSFKELGVPARVAAGFGATPSQRALRSAELLLRPNPVDRPDARSALVEFLGSEAATNVDSAQ